MLPFHNLRVHVKTTGTRCTRTATDRNSNTQNAKHSQSRNKTHPYRHFKLPHSRMTSNHKIEKTKSCRVFKIWTASKPFKIATPRTFSPTLQNKHRITTISIWRIYIYICIFWKGFLVILRIYICTECIYATLWGVHIFDKNIDPWSISHYSQNPLRWCKRSVKYATLKGLHIKQKQWKT